MRVRVTHVGVAKAKQIRISKQILEFCKNEASEEIKHT